MTDCICSIDDCGRQTKARGLCGAHWNRWKRYGNPLAGGTSRVRLAAACSIEGCSEPPWARGWCPKHLLRWRKYGDPLGTAPPRRERLCSVDGCARKHDGHGLCSTHLHRLRHTGSASPDVPIRERFATAREGFCNVMPDQPPLSGCWLWRGSVLSEDEPYGTFVVARQRFLAHRASYEISVGPIPDGLIVRHTCDNPQCVQPLHFLVGTQADNVQDKVDRSRQSRGPSHTNARGSRHPGAILSEADVITIRAMRESGSSRALLAAEFSVSPATISLITGRKTWRHI